MSVKSCNKINLVGVWNLSSIEQNYKQAPITQRRLKELDNVNGNYKKEFS